VAERDDDERLDENVEAIANAAGALLGSVAGPGGAIAGAWLGPKLKRWVRGVWAELSESVRQRQTDVLFWAIREGVPVDEMEARIKASKRTELLTGLALDAAWQTAWEDKVRTLGRSLAEGLLADDNAKIDTEQMIIAAIADIEGPQLAMLELLVAWRPGRNTAEPLISGPLDLPRNSHDHPFGDSWYTAWREWSRKLIARARPNLAPSRRVSWARSSATAWPSRTTRLARRSRSTPRPCRSRSLNTRSKELLVPTASGALPVTPTRRNQRRSPRGHRPSWASSVPAFP
jgi:hypothetical protein